jgi:pimeloyl-ACP methyl ester carboxylesterase
LEREKGGNMGKKKSWKRRVLKIFIVSFGLVILLLVGSVFLLPKFVLQGPDKIEITEYYPFISVEAKEQCLALFKEYEKANWPAESESKYIDTSYGKTFVRITGPKDAHPLVLIHGAGANSLANWSGIIKELSQEYRTYAVDTIGDTGLSICTTPITKPDDYVQWMDELFKGLDLDNNINLMGASYGAWLTGLYAVRFQNRLDKVVLIEPAGTIAPANQQFVVRFLLASLPFEYFKNSLWFDPTVKEYPATKLLDDFIAAFEKLYKVTFLIQPTVLTDYELKIVKCPTLFLVGEHERVFSPGKAMDRLERVVPNFKKKIIPGVGHATIGKSPLMMETIMAFLKE